MMSFGDGQKNGKLARRLSRERSMMDDRGF
jgi:hypothetical protein